MVDGSAVGPGAEPAPALEQAKVCDDLDEDFLDGVLGPVGAPNHADGDIVDPALVTADQPFQGVPVACHGLLDQFLVGRVGVRCFGEGVEHGLSLPG